VKRERATHLLKEMLGRVTAGGTRHLDLVEAISVFGSYARGASEPGDVDVAVEYGRDEVSGHEVVRALAEGRDWTVPYRKALAGRRRGYQFVFGQTERLHNDGFDPILLWRKGEALDAALERLHAIEVDFSAGPAARDAMLPEFEGLDKHLHLPVRRPIVALVESGAIQIERITLEPGTVKHPKARRLIDIRTPNPGVARRVREEGLAWFERQGIDPLTVAAGDRLLRRQPEEHQLSWTLARLNHLPGWFHEVPNDGIWLAIVNPTARAPLTGLKITLANRGKLPEERHLVG
jgi:predicted nucleotidyltransferase